MFRLKEKTTEIPGNACLSVNGKENILMTDHLTTSILKKTSPGIIVMTGAKPVIERNLRLEGKLRAVVVGPEARQHSGLNFINADTVHFVRSKGAFRCRL
jgi:hypothetical protein